MENMSGLSGSDNNSPGWLENFIFDDSQDYNMGLPMVENMSDMELWTTPNSDALVNTEDEIHNPAVSRCTMKRQISRWQPYGGKKANNNKHVGGGVRQEDKPSSSCISTQHLQDMSNSSSTRLLWVKVEYKNDVVKFQLSLPTMDGLKTQVLKRYNNLEGDGLKFMYKDEDGEMITIACDEDLDCCLEYFNSSGRAPVRLSLSF